MSEGHGKRPDRIILDGPVLLPHEREAALAAFREAAPSGRRLVRAVALSSTILSVDWGELRPVTILRQSGGQIAEVLWPERLNLLAELRAEPDAFRRHYMGEFAL